MYQMLQTVLDKKLAMMKDCSYKCYRGSEWLKGEADDGYCFKLYHMGVFVSLDISKYVEEKDKYVEVDRITFRLVDDKLVKEYQRSDYEQTYEKIV